MGKVILTSDRAFVYAQIVGTLSVMLLGVCASLALVFLALWAVAQFLLLLIASLVECFSQVGMLFNSADPFIRFLVLVSLAIAGYWIARKVKSVRYA